VVLTCFSKLMVEVCQMNPLAKVITACVTPFSEDAQRLDAPRFSALCEYLIQNGSDGLLVHGTTGEGPTLTLEEKKQLIQLAKSAIKASGLPVHLMASINGNDTHAVMQQTQDLLAQHERPDSLLVGVPYYNKPTQAGMMAHFEAVASVAQGLPMVIYNIPNRTGVSMQAETMKALHERLGAQLLGVKQSDGNMDALSEITQRLPYEDTGFVVWSGDDSLTLPMLSLGAKGVISVASHLIGAELYAMIDAFQAGKTTKALTLHRQMLPTMRSIFQVTNPILIKACMAQQGFMHPSMRLPMLLEDEHHSMAKVILHQQQALAL
jgi:4-hydroxy-tetrahydrodipicolinate synthase